MLFNMFRLICFTFVVYATVVSAQNINVTIPLNKTLTYENKELFADFITLNKTSILEVKFTSVHKNLSFIIFQVHSHLYNITLYKTDYVKERGNHVIGTNVGLHNSAKKLDTFYVENSYNFTLKLLISVHGYRLSDPIPGGCNMESPVEISPSMVVIQNDKSYIDVEAPPAQASYDVNCEMGSPNITFYVLYLPEKNFEPDVYFDAIRKMSTLKTIEEYGRKIPEITERYWTMRRRLSAYPGVGAIYATVARDVKKVYSIYVPSHSYACSPLIEYDCDIIEDNLSMLFSASLFFLGIFLCYFGHRFFKSQILIIGFLSGFVVTYILLSLIFAIEGPSLVFVSALSGLCIGAIRVICWWLYGIPVFVIILSASDIGFLVASVFYYIFPGGISYLQVDFNFWCLFLLIMLLITICMISISYIANLLCCAVVGAYTAIYPIDYYLGSNLKYILNNTIRRATVADFNKAVVIPPFQWNDGFLLATWIVLASTGFMYQFYQNRGKPPFPPPPKSVRAVPEDPAEPFLPEISGPRISNYETDYTSYHDERTPLLG